MKPNRKVRKENLEYYKNTDCKESDFNCSCGGILEIYHLSNWHNGTGVYYTCCNKCQKETNVGWKKL